MLFGAKISLVGFVPRQLMVGYGAKAYGSGAVRGSRLLSEIGSASATAELTRRESGLGLLADLHLAA
jgi:hypothetical protein